VDQGRFRGYPSFVNVFAHLAGNWRRRTEPGNLRCYSSSLVMNVTSTFDPQYPGHHQMAFDSANSTTRVRVAGDTEILVDANNGLPYGQLDFELYAPAGQKLHVGTYTGVHDTMGYDPDYAGLRLVMGSSMETVNAGEVQIRDLGTDAAGKVTRLDLVFRVNPASPANSWFGSVRFGEAETPGRTLSARVTSWPMSPVGAPQVLATESLHNTGPAPLSVGAAAVTGADSADFTLAADSCSGRTLLPGQACPVVVGFTPTGPGQRSANLSLPVGNGTDTVELRGEAPPGFSRLLTSGDDYVSHGVVHDYVDGPYQLVVTGNRRQLVFAPTKVYDYQFDGLQVWLRGPVGQPMTTGDHPAEDYFASQGDPADYGIEVFGMGRGCGVLSGSVNIKELTYAPDGTLGSADIAFTQICQDDAPGAVMTGEIKWRLPVATPAVVITAKPAPTTSSTAATFSFSPAPGTDAAVPLRYLCALDGAPAAPCAGPQTYTGLTSGSHTFTVTVTGPSGNPRSATYTWLVDQVAPTVVMTAPGALYSLCATLTPAWTARDVGAGMSSVDVRWARAPWGGGFGPTVYPAGWQKSTASQATLSGVAGGYTYCFSARARDRAGNLSAWSAPRCSAVALDDRSLTASSGWARNTGSAFYRGTATTTSSPGATLTLAGIQTRHIYLVATRCPTCGIVGLWWNGALVDMVNLYAPTTSLRAVVATITFPSVRTGTLTVGALTSKTVQVDGVALTRG
jgi:hypothetical protein